MGARNRTRPIDSGLGAIEAKRKSPELAGLPRKQRRPHEPGKDVRPEMLRTDLAKALEDAVTRHALDLKMLGVRSYDELVTVLETSVESLRTRSGHTRITVNNWIGEVFELLGGRHPVVVRVREELVASVLAEARRNGQTFVDGFGNLHTVTAKFKAASITHVTDLRIRRPGQKVGTKYCDRASLCPNEKGEVLFVLSEEYKTAGVKSSDRDAQLGARNTRLMASDLPPDSILTFITSDGQLIEQTISELRFHVENPGNLLAIQARSKLTTIDVRGTARPRARFTEVYYWQRIQWPGRQLRRVMENVLAAR